MSFQLNKAYNRDSFVEFLTDKFLPEDFNAKRNAEEIILSRAQHFATSAYRLGYCPSLELEVFEIHHTSLNDARVGIAKDAFQLLLHHSFCNRALIAFVPEGSKQWRFSLIQIEAELNEHNRITRGYSNPRRFSFLLGEESAIKTPTQFLIEKGRINNRTDNGKTQTPWEDLQYRFSVEALTKDFYQKLFNWYLWAKDSSTGVTFPNNPQTADDDRDKMEVKMIRLITRMLFVWFIKQKHLVPNYLFDTDYLKSILRDFDPQSLKQGNYYNAILQNLFFATLNQEQEKRSFTQPSFHGKGESYGVKTLYRDNQRQSWFTFPEEKKEEEVVKLFAAIPYLNGGLFECLDKFDLNVNGKYRPITYYDGFSTHDTLSDNKKNLKYRAFIPNALFFLEKPTMVTVETGQVQVIGLIELFKQYNFTVEENTTTDAEVSLDPELLGRVFENLLADYNPDTQKSARKSTGSYYTPREIVDYMVDESLKAYLTGECQNDKDEVAKLFSEGKVSSSDIGDKIVQDLRSMKILDPACGSGAFPMGILLRTTDLIEHLEGERFNRYETKLQLIKDCIYGIDIQPIAMLICKLRFFISLICDSEKDESQPNLGIIPLPNLETKFVAANSLLPAKVKAFDNDLLHDDDLQAMKEQLLGLRKEILEVRRTSRKMEIRKKDRELCKKIQKYIIEQASKPDEEKIANLRKVIADCEEQLPNYKEDYWVDEMVTQTSLFDTGEPTIFRRNINKEKRDDLNSRIRSAQADIRREENKTTQDGFFEAVKQVTEWDPYNQNAESPFFDAEWMFGIGLSRPSKQGFDIVIGNPPYVSSKELNKEDKELYKSHYISAGNQMDLYSLFIELAMRLLKPNAISSYIVPDSLIGRSNFSVTRNEMICKRTILKWLHLNEVFESANVSSVIYVLKNESLEDYTFEYDKAENVRQWMRGIINKVTIKKSLVAQSDGFKVNFSTESENNLLQKLYCNTKLGNIMLMWRGEEMGRKSTLISSLRTTTGIPILAGDNVHRYEPITYNRYIDRDNVEKKYYEKPKLLIRQLGTCINATLDENRCITLQSIYNLALQDDNVSQLKFILGLLNSKLYDFLYNKASGDKQMFQRIILENIKQLPYPNSSNEQQLPIINLVEKILEKKQSNLLSDVSVEEKEIDNCVYNLFGLDENERQIVENG